MLFHTWGQSKVFLSMLYAGLAIGAWYDVLRFVRRVLQAGRVFTWAMDVLFGVGTFVVLAMSMMLVNYGEMRVYCLLGAACGVVLYMFTVGPLLRICVVKPAQWLKGRLVWLLSRPLAKKIFR